MKKIFLNLIAVLTATAALAQTDETPYLIKALDGETIRNVKIQTGVGAITVTGGSEKARLEVYVTKGNRRNGEPEKVTKAEIDALLKEDYELDIQSANGNLTAIAKTRRKLTNGWNNVSISFKAYLPEKVMCDLNTSVGAIKLENLNGMQKAKSSVGAMSINKCNGTLDLNSSTGAFAISNTKGKVKAVTSTGAIKVTDFTGELTAKTSTGSLQLDNISGSLDASSSTGSARIQMSAVEDFVKVGVSVGSINLQLPSGKGMDLNLSGRNVKAELANFSGTKEKNRVEGKLNGGGIPVDVKTSIGSITLDLL